MGLSPGARFAGYWIEELIARGGMGVIYRARESQPPRTVALKIVAPELAAEPGFRVRFLRESELAASIEHPNVIPVLRVGEEDETLFMAMRFIYGTDLRALIASEGPLDPRRAAMIIDQVGDALDAAHERGLVHRDVKPGNILIEARRRREHAYLTDFGLTKRLASTAALTDPGRVVGTVDYAAPEQLLGEPIDARADVYSLGCVLFEALTGRVPYERDRPEAVIYAHVQAPLPKVSETAAAVSPSFDDIVGRALAKAPADRYPSAGDLAMAATVTAEGQPVRREERMVASGAAAPARRPESGTKPTSVAKRFRRVLAIAAAATALGVVVVASLVGAPAPVSSGASSRVARGLPVGRHPYGITIDGSTVWVANASDGTVRAITRNGVLSSPISVGRDPTGIAVGQGEVWVTNRALNRVTHLDEEFGTVDHIAVGPSPAGIAVGADAVWVANGGNDSVTKINPISQKVETVIRVGMGPFGIALGQGSVWVTNTRSDSLARIDPVSGRVATIRVGSQPTGVTVSRGSVWVANSEAGTVMRISAASGKVLATIPVGPHPVGIAVGSTSVWVTNSYSNTVTRISTVSRVVRSMTIPVGMFPTGIAASGGSVWVANSTGNTVTRIDAQSGKVETR